MVATNVHVLRSPFDDSVNDPEHSVSCIGVVGRDTLSSLVALFALGAMSASVAAGQAVNLHTKTERMSLESSMRRLGFRL